MDLRHSCSYQEVMRTRPVSCDLTYLVDATTASYNSWPTTTMFRKNYKPRAQKRYRTVGIGSSAAYCGGKNAEVVIAALNRGGSVRPACAYCNQLLERWEKDKDKPRHAAAQSRLLSSRLISALDMSTCNPDTPAAQCRSDIM
jgi:hypothetical protein